MAVADCLVKIKDYLKANGLDKKIPSQRLLEFANMIEKAGGDSLNDAQFNAKIQDIIDNEVKRFNAKVRAAKIITLAKLTDSAQQILDNKALWDKQFDEGKKGPWLGKIAEKANMAAEAFRAWLEGGALREGTGTNRSVNLTYHTINQSLLNTFDEALRLSGVSMESVVSGKLDTETLKALEAIDNGYQYAANNEDEQMAKGYAKAIKELRDTIFDLKQAKNPFLERAREYLMRQFYDREKVAAVPKMQWVAKMMDRAGENSFAGKSFLDKTVAFAKMYDSIVNGTYGGKDENYLAGTRSADIWKQQAKGRSVIFNDSDSWIAHFKEYGPNTLFDGLHTVMERGARDVALTDKFSPVPKLMYEGVYKKVLDNLQERAKQTGEANDIKAAEHFASKKKDFDELFNIVNGSQNCAAESRKAVVQNGLAIWQYLVHGGNAVLRSLQDPAFAGSLARDFNGKTVFENSFDIGGAFARGFANIDDARKGMQAAGVYLKSAHLEMLGQLGTPDKPGSMSKIGRAMGVVTMMQRRTDAMRNSIGNFWAAMMHDESGKAWSSLQDQQRNFLSRYDIGEHEWNVIRQAKGDIDGTSVVLPDLVRGLSDDVAEKYLRDSGQFKGDGKPSSQLMNNARWDISTRLGTMYNEMADQGSLHMDTRQRAFLWGDTNADQWKGVVWRMVTQFKSAATVAADIARRSYYSSASPKGSYNGIMQLGVQAMFLYTVGEYLKQLSEGKEPESPTSPEFMLKMAAGSGLAGLWGDSMLGEINNPDQTSRSAAIAKGLLGPIPSFGIDALSLAAQKPAEAMGVAKYDKNWGSRVENTIYKNTIPNLFWTKSLLNYTLFNSMHQFMGNDGYLNALEGRTAKTSGLINNEQQYLFDWNRPTRSAYGDTLR